MGLAEEWKQLPGGTKMFIIGGGATAVFILVIALKGKNTATQQQQATTQATLDPSGWIDAQTQQTQYVQQMIDSINSTVTQNQQANTQALDQNNKAMQQLITQNQQATQQQIQTLINNMPKSTPAAPAPTPPPSPSPAAPAHNGGSYTVQPGDNLWNIIKYRVMPGASNAQIVQEVNVLAAANHIRNPNLIYPGQQINW
jgi:TolA-binding protein